MSSVEKVAERESCVSVVVAAGSRQLMWHSLHTIWRPYWQIHFAIWNKYILQFESYTFGTLNIISSKSKFLSIFLIFFSRKIASRSAKTLSLVWQNIFYSLQQIGQHLQCLSNMKISPHYQNSQNVDNDVPAILVQQAFWLAWVVSINHISFSIALIEIDWNHCWNLRPVLCIQ